MFYCREDMYTELMNIKNPVMITVKSKYPDHRFRILYPDGVCEFIYAHNQNSMISKKSCFTRHSNDLKSTVQAMEDYDLQQELDVVDIVEL
jgi:hypothetical protein